MSEHQLEITSELSYCEVHPSRETNLRCNRCNRLMCNECAALTPVGYRCKECVREQQNTYFNAAIFDYVISAGIAVILSAIGAFVVGIFGFFIIAIIASPIIGTAIASATQNAVGMRRGRYTWLVVGASIVIGALLTVIFSGFDISWLLYVILATGAAMSQLRTRWLRIGR